MNKKNLQSELHDAKSLRRCAERFGVIGDLTRLKICWLLCKHPEMTVGEISDVLEIEQSNISHALRKLKEAGVVSNRKESTFKFYSLNDSPICSFIKENIS